MRPRPWLLLCVSLHGVAASVYGFPSGKHGLDYCIAEADTHHRHDSVDHHGTSNHMWDANAALLKAACMPISTNVAGMCEHNPIHENTTSTTASPKPVPIIDMTASTAMRRPRGTDETVCGVL